MDKKRLFTDKIKIKAAKNLMVPFLIATVTSTSLLGITGFMDTKQNKQLESLEKLWNPSDDQVREYREEIKKYFANYINSPEAKTDFIQKTSMDEYIYDELAKNGFDNILSEEDINEIMDIALQELLHDNDLMTAGQYDEAALYSALYNKLLYRVRDNLVNNNAFTVTETVTYDANKILQESRNQIISVQNRLQNQNTSKPISVTDVRDAYVADLVDKYINSLLLTDEEKRMMKTSVLDELISYFESKEGKKLLVDGKNGTDGKPIDWSDQEILKLKAEIENSLIQYIIDNRDSLTVKSISGETLNLTESICDVKCMAGNIGLNSTIQLSWNRGDWDESKRDKIIKFEVQSFDGMSLSQNASVNFASMMQDITMLTSNDPAPLSNSGSGTIAVTRGNVTQEYSVSTIVDAFAYNYMSHIYQTLNTKPIGNICVENNKNLCSVTENDVMCKKELTPVYNDNGTEIIYYTCPDHDIVAVSFKEMFKQSNITLQHAKELGSAANKEYGTDGYQETTSQFDTVDNAVESSVQYVLDMYNETLQALDEGHEDFKSVFDYYSKYMANVDHELNTALNHYGFETEMDAECLNSANVSESVIVNHLMHEHYVVRNANGKLEFITPAGFDETDKTKTEIMTAKLENAYNSPIIQIMEKYMNYTNSDSSNGMIGLINQWSENLTDIMELIDFAKGDGYTYTINAGEHSEVIIKADPANPADQVKVKLFELFDVYLSEITEPNTTTMILSYQILASNPNNLKADLVTSAEERKITGIYYEKKSPDNGGSEIHIKLNETLNNPIKVKIWFR